MPGKENQTNLNPKFEEINDDPQQHAVESLDLIHTWKREKFEKNLRFLQSDDILCKHGFKMMLCKIIK